ncbi:subtilisin-like protein [Ascodesmis nigricans]|uniref:Subtilisin-like protein n=1 Tax=Ascodesmis nigricans TaxID=341454 RepID=A0A4V3SIU3_9PEZI|nr:subtilisin-like protein [Ascodesmis nigricans]
MSAEETTFHAEAIPNSYVVVFKPHVSKEACDKHCEWASQCCSQRISALGGSHQYDGIKDTFKIKTVQGYTCNVDAETKKQIEESDEVEFVEPDMKVYASEIVTAETPSWGLGRICSKEKQTGEGRYTKYMYDDSAGEGVRVYVVDTGILAEHEDFGGRATFAYNAIAGSSDTDKNGHGTHCAGTVGGTKYGVAKKATILGVKVLGDDGSGSNSTVLAGMQWALEDASTHDAVKTSVISMSLGGGKSVALNRAVKAIVDEGLTICVAAGNESRDAKFSSPASEESCLTVGSTDINDKLSTFSNYGSLVDVLAPGTAITSTWIDEDENGSTSNTNTISGTSMATPHVAGLCAYLIAKEKLSGSDQVMGRIKELAGKGIAGLKANTPDRLAYNGVEVAGSPVQREEPEKVELKV